MEDSASRSPWDPRIDKAETILALEAAHGNVSSAAFALGVKRGYLHSKIATDPDLQEIVADLEQVVVDKAQENVYNKVLTGDADMSWKILQTLGKDRGFSTRVESTGKGGGPVQIGDINVNFVPAGPKETTPNDLEPEL